MYQYLLDHAMQNVWCNNEQDNQLVFAAKKISSNGGALNIVRAVNRKIVLPTKGKYYHVYQIGQINPTNLGLLNIDPVWQSEKWHLFTEAMNELKLIVNLYNSDGIELPRYKSWYMLSDDNALLVAVEDNDIFKINFKSELIYLRLYTNAYFQSSRSDVMDDVVYSAGMDVKTNGDITDIINQYNIYKSKSGFVFCYVNGFLVNTLDLSTIKLFDLVEFVYDSSVKRVVTFTIKDLPTFNSELDKKYKYLLHYPVDASMEEIIDYHDDNDIHILYKASGSSYSGRYYHHNQVDSVRMVTHRDYSVVVEYVDSISQSIMTDITKEMLDIKTFQIQIKIRKSGYFRKLVQDHNRIFELYKLPDDKLVQCITGVNSTVPEWNASVLEASGYTEIMRVGFNDLTLEAMQRGYGYNSLSRIVGDTPMKVSITDVSVPSCTLPYGLHTNSTVYEYDKDGYLLGHYAHTLSTTYECSNASTKLIEAISGRGTYTPHVVFGTDGLELHPYHNYRVYISILDDGFSKVWQDITGSDQYKVIDNKLKWLKIEALPYLLMVRFDDTFLAYDLNLGAVSGTFYFSLSEIETRDGVSNNYELPVPMGELDIFLNGKSLIRGLDYIIKFPMVYIINKEYLVQPSNITTQKVHVRFTGFSNGNLELDEIEDYGFVMHGLLSNNNKYDIRDDKVLRITMDGATLHRSDLVFSEFTEGISVVNSLNGKPYQIKDIVVPLKELVNENTYSLRNKSIAVDKRVSDYLTNAIPQPIRSAVSAIPNRYEITSPFITHIVNDLATDLINMSNFSDELTDMDIINACKPYERILPFDPIYKEVELDAGYVIIQPHNLDVVVTLSLLKYRFLMRVVKLYGNNLVELAPFIAVNPRG